MDFKDLVRARYSARAYLDRPVEPQKLDLVLEAARLAPTAANRQPFRLVVVSDPQIRADMKAAYHRRWFYTAPLIVAACGVPSENWVRCDGKNYNDVDVAIVMDYLTLQAADIGLGTCWIADFDPDAVRDILHLPADLEPVALTPLGYSADEPKAKQRKPLDRLVVHNRFS
ncbi:MAG: nitroreductase family protein [Thermoleophilia bacterium]|nr:nitroreductase family protein [Thermoleophilia bacterium]